jgi:hypothetical protein
MWNMMPINTFLRHCADVGLKTIIQDMKLRRAETEARLAAAAGEYVPTPDTSVKAKIIPFRKPVV